MSRRPTPASNHPFADRFALVIEAARREMERVLVEPIAISEDRVLQILLRRAADTPATRPCSLKLDGVEVWLELGRRQDPRLLRAPLGGQPEISLTALRRHDSRLERAVQAAAKISGAKERARAIAGIACGAHEPTQRQFATLAPWTPLLEGVSYRAGLQLAVIIDDLRRSLLNRRRDPDYFADLRTYWDAVQALRRLVLLVCNPGARPWLTETMQGPDWARQSPSWLLARERTIGLAQAGAWAAAAFGPPAIEGYLARLARASSSMLTFDALLGLTAIGLSETGLAPTVVVELTAFRRRAAASPAALAALGDAIAVLREPERLALAFDAVWPERPSRTGRSPPERAPAHLDPLTVWPEGPWLGLAVLPRTLSANLHALYPRGETERTPPPSLALVERLFDRAWRAGDGAPGHADPWRG